MMWGNKPAEGNLSGELFGKPNTLLPSKGKGEICPAFLPLSSI